MADTVQIAGGPKARIPNLPDRGLGYCTDTTELYIGTPSGNQRVNAPELAQEVAQLRENLGAALGAVQALEGGLAALQGAVDALTARVAALENGGTGK